MSHPNDEQLSGFLYDDDNDHDAAATRSTVERHLEGCDDCRRRVASWRAVRRELGAWEPSPAAAARPVPPTFARRRPFLLRPMLGRAVAAAAFVAVGYGLARVAFVRYELPHLRAELTRQVRSEMDERLGAFAADQAAERRGFQRSVGEALDSFSTRHAAEQAALRRDVETVALASQEEFARLERSSGPAAPSARPAVPTP